MHMRCITCKTIKSPEDFPWKNQVQGTRATYCLECKKAYNKVWYAKNKDKHKVTVSLNNQKYRTRARNYTQEYLKTHPCVDCGNTDIEVLQFDHRDRELKQTEIINLFSGSIQSIQQEIDKCDVRCANCHIKRTRRQMGWWTTD